MSTLLLNKEMMFTTQSKLEPQLKNSTEYYGL